MNLGLHVQQVSALPLTIVPASIPDFKEDSQWQDWATGQHCAAQNRREGVRKVKMSRKKEKNVSSQMLSIHCLSLFKPDLLFILKVVY